MDLSSLARLVAEHPEALAHPVAPVRIGGVVRDLDAEPLIMGVVNLSRDSTYRDSVAVSPDSAIRRARVMHAQGAGVVDLGAESSTLRAARVGDSDQAAALVPVIEALTAEGVPTSVEAYSPRVVAECLRAGASVVNLTGATDLEEIYGLAAAHDAAVVMCFLPGANVREVGDVTLDSDPIPGLIDYFAERISHAHSHGVENLVIDPGLGFYYGNLTDPTGAGPPPVTGPAELVPTARAGRADLPGAAPRLRPLRGGVPDGRGGLRGPRRPRPRERLQDA